MKCTLCKNGEYATGRSSIMFDKKGSIVIFKNVPALICNNCGARPFDPEVSAKLLQQAREARRKGAELEVVNLKAA